MTKEAVSELKKKIASDKGLEGDVAAVRATAVNAMLGIAGSKGLNVSKSDAHAMLTLLAHSGSGDGSLSLDQMASLSGGGDTGGGGGGFGGGGGGQGGTGGTNP